MDVIFMLSGHLVGAFRIPFGCLLDAFSSPRHPWGPFWRISEISRKRHHLGEFMLGPYFNDMLILLQTCRQYVFAFFLDCPIVRFFKLFVNSGFHLVPIWMPRDLQNRPRTLTGVRFLHFGPVFVQARFLGMNLLPTFARCGVL